jgi:hypothetical protein
MVGQQADNHDTHSDYQEQNELAQSFMVGQTGVDRFQFPVLGKLGALLRLHGFSLQ